MRSKWKGIFIMFSKNIPYTNSKIKNMPFDISVYNGKKWSILSLFHKFMSGYCVNSFVLHKIIGNIHSEKRKQRKKINIKKKKNG